MLNEFLSLFLYKTITGAMYIAPLVVFLMGFCRCLNVLVT